MSLEQRSARRRWLCALIGGIVFLIGAGRVWADVDHKKSLSKEGPVASQVEFKLTYQVSDREARVVHGHVLDIITIGSREFLVFHVHGFKDAGFIALESVRSILPHHL